MLWGPMNHLKHLANIDRLLFSISYILTLIGTIYYSIWVNICYQLYLIIKIEYLDSKLFFNNYICFITNKYTYLVNFISFFLQFNKN